MTIRNEKIQLQDYSIDISGSVSMMAIIHSHLEYKVDTKQGNEIPLTIKWVVSLNDINLNKPLGKYSSTQVFYITGDDVMTIKNNLVEIYVTSQSLSRELFVNESKAKQMEVPAWDSSVCPDEYVQEVLAALQPQL